MSNKLAGQGQVPSMFFRLEAHPFIVAGAVTRACEDAASGAN
jgi:hypothetical protein